MKIYIDENYPNKVIELLESLHRLTGNGRYIINRWGNDELSHEELKGSIFLGIDYESKGVSIPFQKLYEDGYRIFVCKAANTSEFSRFRLAMTLFTVWPSLLKTSEKNQDKFLYSFNYGGKRLSCKFCS